MFFALQTLGEKKKNKKYIALKFSFSHVYED